VWNGNSYLANYVERQVSQSVVYIGRIYEKNTSTGEEVKYYYLGDRLLAVRRVGGASAGLYYPLLDHLGSTVGILDEYGNVVKRSLYFAYGRSRLSTGGVPTEKLFTGQDWDDPTGLYYYGARWYDPYLARFIQPDTIVPDPKDPQSLNRYSYTLNNPLKYDDPTGRCIESPLDVAFIAFDLYQIGIEGLTTENAAALVVDVACLAMPGATGGGLAVRAISRGGEAAAAVAKAGSHVPAGARAAQVGLKGLQAGDDLGQAAQQIGEGTAGPPDDAIPAIDPPRDPEGLRRHMEDSGVPKPLGFTKPQAHHELPWKFKDWFAGERRGLDVNDPQFGRWVEGTPPGQHQNWSSEYNADWERWIRSHSDATREEVLQHLQDLRGSGRYQ